MATWSATFRSVKDVRAAGTRGRAKSEGTGPSGNPRDASAGGAEGADWWDDVSHQAQRVAHVAAASAFASGGGEVRTRPCGLTRISARYCGRPLWNTPPDEEYVFVNRFLSWAMLALLGSWVQLLLVVMMYGDVAVGGGGRRSWVQGFTVELVCRLGEAATKFTVISYMCCFVVFTGLFAFVILLLVVLCAAGGAVTLRAREAADAQTLRKEPAPQRLDEERRDQSIRRRGLFGATYCQQRWDYF